MTTNRDHKLSPIPTLASPIPDNSQSYDQFALTVKLNKFLEALKKLMQSRYPKITNWLEEIDLFGLDTSDICHVILIQRVEKCKAKLEAERKIENGGFFCNGLMLSLFLALRKNVENEWYSCKEEMINCPDDELLKKTNLFECFIDHIYSFQWPTQYLEKTEVKTHFDIDKILPDSLIAGHKKEVILSASYLNSLLTKLPHNSFVIFSNILPYGQIASSHGIGIFCRVTKENGRHFFLFDANYETGKAKIFCLNKNIDYMVDEVNKQLFTKFGLSNRNVRCISVIEHIRSPRAGTTLFAPTSTVPTSPTSTVTTCTTTPGMYM